MRQMYFCPQCRALIARGDRFCSNCGTHLNWVVLQTPPRTASQSSSGCQYPDREQTPERPLPLRNQQPASRQQHNISKELGTVPQKKSSSASGAITPISTEISKLLAEFLNKQVNNN